MSEQPEANAVIRTVLGDIDGVPAGVVYAHEHLIIDSPLIEAKFPHIRLDSVESGIEELRQCAAFGVALVLDCMPCSAGRDVARLAEISRGSGVAIVAATGLHHDRYYGPSHWSNRISEHTLAELFVADIVDGIDEFDYTGPVVRRSDHRAGFIKVATSGERLDARDSRNLAAASEASVRTGAPILTHCEGGWGGLEQVAALTAAGVPARRIILSHVDKTHDRAYMLDLAATGVFLELDQGLRESAKGVESVTVRTIVDLVDAGHAEQIVIGTDGARRSLWTSLGGSPGLAWLAASLPALLGRVGLDDDTITRVMRTNAVAALSWHAPASLQAVAR